MNILADASLPDLAAAFPKPFQLSLYHCMSDLPALLVGKDILLCRANLKVTPELLQNHSLKIVATASSGTDHIDTHYLQQHNIRLIDAKGANATAVADYVMASLAYLQQHKEFSGKTAGVIGVGEVGSRVVKRLEAIFEKVLCYDPLNSKIDSDPLSAIQQCDLIAIHANLHDTLPFPSLKLLNAEFLSQLKPNTAIINAARGGIVDEEALLQLSQPILYCTDVFENEPTINKNIVNLATLCTPHIAGHSVEAKHQAVTWVSQKLHRLFHWQPPKMTCPTPISKNKEELISENWQSLVLSLYNPFAETQELKAASSLTDAFLTLRKAHQFRHHFCELTSKLGALLG